MTRQAEEVSALRAIFQRANMDVPQGRHFCFLCVSAPSRTFERHDRGITTHILAGSADDNRRQGAAPLSTALESAQNRNAGTGERGRENASREQVNAYSNGRVQAKKAQVYDVTLSVTHG